MTVERIALLALRWLSVAAGTLLAKKAWVAVQSLAAKAVNSDNSYKGGR